MRMLLNLIVMVVFLAAQAGQALAGDAKTFIVTADVPEVFNGGVVEEGIIGQGPVKDTDLTWDFGTLSFNPEYGIWIASKGYYITLNGDVSLEYTEGENPNTTAGYSGHGLGYKTAIAFKDIIGTTEVDIMPARAIRNVNGLTIPDRPSDHNIKMYVGIYTGDPVVSGAEVFTNADHAGTYQGTLTITVVTK